MLDNPANVSLNKSLFGEDFAESVVKTDTASIGGEDIVLHEVVRRKPELLHTELLSDNPTPAE